jgi:hydroxyacylglutathione hydrolase
MPLSVSLVPCLDDNYGFLVRDEETGATAAVDTPDAGPILDALKERGWALDIILNTHKHGDHIGGNQALRERTGAMVVGPGEVAERTHVDWVVKGGDCVSLGATEFFVIDTGGHTLGHVSYYAWGAATVFVGDTLFAMGCGRLFEGTAEQMWASLSRLAALPPETQVYCAHEYTLANADFALSVDDSRRSPKGRRRSWKLARSGKQPCRRRSAWSLRRIRFCVRRPCGRCLSLPKHLQKSAARKMNLRAKACR